MFSPLDDKQTPVVLAPLFRTKVQTPLQAADL